ATGKRMVVGNGYARERQVMTGTGMVDVRAPRVDDRRDGEPGVLEDAIVRAIRAAVVQDGRTINLLQISVAIDPAWRDGGPLNRVQGGTANVQAGRGGAAASS
ncbi:MAG: hypothetical protein ACRD0U_00820, partial [Acidimicrobiales bacterium]